MPIGYFTRLAQSRWDESVWLGYWMYLREAKLPGQQPPVFIHKSKLQNLAKHWRGRLLRIVEENTCSVWSSLFIDQNSPKIVPRLLPHLVLLTLWVLHFYCLCNSKAAPHWIFLSWVFCPFLKWIALKKKAEWLSPGFAAYERVDFPGWLRRLGIIKGSLISEFLLMSTSKEQLAGEGVKNKRNIGRGGCHTPLRTW